ncbi:MAG: peptide ABC transporter substrate-binding protein [Chloroflexota bacterium]|nr:peptide ABC transporter substrate-binding protein [Chloroflexota bacterium]
MSDSFTPSPTQEDMMTGLNKKRFFSLLALLVLLSLIVSACQPAPAAPAAPAASPTPLPQPATPVPTKEAAETAPEAEEAPAEAPAGEYVNAFGVTLPADAAPPDQQYLRVMIGPTYGTIDFPVAVYNRPDPPWQTLSTPLIRLDKNFELQPAAAESWEVADDGLTWTFHLDPELTWSDGVPVTAHDYEWSFQYMADPEHAYDFAWYWGYSSNPKNWDKVVSGELPLEELGVKAIDDFTLQVVTELPAPYTPATMIFSRPMAKHQVEKFGEFYNNDPETSLSSEPWILEEWTKGKQIVMAPNLNYTGKETPYLERFTFIYGDKNQEFNAYLADELDLSHEWFSPADLEFIAADPELSAQYNPGFGDFRTYYVFFDTFNPPFDDLNVRKAFAHAIDRQGLVDNIVKFSGQVAYGMLMPGFPDALPPSELEQYQAYDPELAQSLLAEAGYPGGEGFPPLVLNLRQAKELEVAVGNGIGAMLNENLGIDVEITNTDSKTFMDAMNAYEITIGEVSYGMDYFDASNLLGIWKSGGRHAWENEEFDQLVTEAAALMGDLDTRSAMFEEAQRILAEDVGGIFLWHGTPADMWKPYIRGDQLEPDKFGVQACHWPCFESISTTKYSVYVTEDVADYPRGQE